MKVNYRNALSSIDDAFYNVKDIWFLQKKDDAAKMAWYDKMNDFCLLEWAKRVGKSTIAEEFAKNKYKSYISIFSKLTKEEDDVFENINDLDFFFLRLQTVKGRILKGRKSVIIFDEIQFAPKIRRAIKHLVKDGRYDYIETGSLISIKRMLKIF